MAHLDEVLVRIDARHSHGANGGGGMRSLLAVAVLASSVVTAHALYVATCFKSVKGKHVVVPCPKAALRVVQEIGAAMKVKRHNRSV
jgi:hypothetical protein